jgi:hypothetical protein
MTVGVSAFLAAGCSMLSFGRDEPRASAPAPVAAMPAGSVTGGTLPPPGQSASTGETLPGAVTPPVDAGMQTASATPTGATPTAAAAAPGTLGRTDLLGGWTISSAGDSCQLFMTLTTWAGGYRASTRGCTNAALTTISAWNMDGGQVQLFNDAGATIARLYPASKTLFNGQTEGGGPVTVSR